MAAAPDQAERAGPRTRSIERLGWTIAGLTACVLLVSAAGKLLRTDAAMTELARLGYDAATATGIGVAQLAGTILYVFPATGVLGAILITAYMGGGAAAHLIAGDPVAVPVLTAAAAWLGLVLRDPAVRGVVPWRARGAAPAR